MKPTTVSYETGYIIGIDPALGNDECVGVIYDRKTGKIVDPKDLVRDAVVKIERHMLDRIHSVFGCEPKVVEGEVLDTLEGEQIIKHGSWLAAAIDKSIDHDLNFHDGLGDPNAIEGEVVEPQRICRIVDDVTVETDELKKQRLELIKQELEGDIMDIMRNVNPPNAHVVDGEFVEIKPIEGEVVEPENSAKCHVMLFDSKTGKCLSQDPQRKLSDELLRDIEYSHRLNLGLPIDVIEGEVVRPAIEYIGTASYGRKISDVVNDMNAIEGECVELKEQKMIGNK